MGPLPVAASRRHPWRPGKHHWFLAKLKVDELAQVSFCYQPLLSIVSILYIYIYIHQILHRNDTHQYILYLTGGIPTPLKNDGLRQLG